MRQEPEAVLSHEKLASAVGDADVLFLDSNLRSEVNAFMKDLRATSLNKQLPAPPTPTTPSTGSRTR
ncbi:hypothetical protein SAM23877_0560 [Streptomyces ambofaciens ATCC 23877]|uniref:Uncharacterized protein n=1 Tax=Streptomyces ambofaciens (strain ATCC 23877 / 3486 / DSM 40053 / JCM 4204 / NBRC 12836 / NRRL B-2516) TaxID=278992 RepID=A0A0K2AKU1_STRA7|nr:hypothetical protein [Streptomyces ambofaciens]AKZ53609.1 hypothetical protein SAM23877_0560 [Streptomyces ambofaciens ATCC 23877]